MPAAELKSDGLVLRVRLTPKSSAERIEGIEAGFIHARVRALPSDGKANIALIALLAKTLGLPKSAFRLAAGAKGREKTVVASADPGDLQNALRRLEALPRTAAVS